MVLAKYREGKLLFNVKHTIMFSLQYMFCEGTVKIQMGHVQAMLVMSISYLDRRFADVEFRASIALVFINYMCRTTVVFWFKYNT